MSTSLLIVDDSSTMRKIIMRTLRVAGIEFDSTEEAGNGLEAIDKLKESPVDIVLCDLNMPEMNGMEMVKKVRTEIPDCNDTKIIMVTTESAQETIDEAIDNGANGLIAKPFTPDKFKEKISQYMQVSA